ncbi:MAG: hypothetical protein MJ198_09165 [Bacteroidales bacterium]|nr:hypothetical protein [Bacteroidales bacterium]
MKKVLLVLALGASMVALSSCFGRECVCTVKVDGEKITKTIDFENECQKTGKWSEKNPLTGTEYEYKCK